MVSLSRHFKWHVLIYSGCYVLLPYQLFLHVFEVTWKTCFVLRSHVSFSVIPALVFRSLKMQLQYRIAELKINCHKWQTLMLRLKKHHLSGHYSSISVEQIENWIHILAYQSSKALKHLKYIFSYYFLCCFLVKIITIISGLVLKQKC